MSNWTDIASDMLSAGMFYALFAQPRWPDNPNAMIVYVSWYMEVTGHAPVRDYPMALVDIDAVASATASIGIGYEAAFRRRQVDVL